MRFGAADLLWNHCFPLLTRLTCNKPVIFLNCGYAEDGPSAQMLLLTEEDEPDRPCIQLYDSVVRPIPMRP